MNKPKSYMVRVYTHRSQKSLFQGEADPMRFATRAEALEHARYLYSASYAVESCQVLESQDEPTEVSK